MEVVVGEKTLNSPLPPPLTEKHEEPVTFRSSSTAAPLLQDGKMLVKLRIGSLIVGDSLQIRNGGGDEHGGGGGGGGGGDVPMKIEEEFPLSSSSINGRNNPNHGIRVCPECFKEFNSGKALGGHMRIHVQEATRKKQLLKPQKTTMFKNLHQHKLQQNPNPVQIMNGDRGEIPTCYHCGKTFPSKKSLYGHMRCHPEREWRGVIPPRAAVEGGGGIRFGLMKTFKTSSSSASLSSSHESIDFDMLMQPQPQLTTSGNDDGIYAFDDEDDDVDESHEAAVDLVKSLPSWATKAKRGRKAVSIDEEDEVLREVAQDLMLLAQGGAQSFAESGLTQRAAARVDDQFEGSNSNSENDDGGGLKLGSTEVGKVKAKGGAVMETATIGPTAAMDDVVDQGNLNNWLDNESDSRNTHDHLLMLGLNKYDKLSSPNTKLDHSGGIGKMVKKRKKMKLMMELDPNSAWNMIGTIPPPLKPMLGNLATTTTSPDQPSNYRCITCNKCFLSHQALGGHRSSHNKVKLPSAAVNTIDHHRHHENQEGDDEEDGSFVIHQLQGGEGEMVEKELSAAQHHECKICHKVFPTGQALGGHKRCHWTGGQVAEQAPSSQVTSNSPGEASLTTGSAAPARRVLDFDLNEAPPMEDEAVVGYGYGYSSSHNSNMG